MPILQKHFPTPAILSVGTYWVSVGGRHLYQQQLVLGYAHCRVQQPGRMARSRWSWQQQVMPNWFNRHLYRNWCHS